MGAYDSWCAQKQKLREALAGNEDTSAIAYAVRHTLAQVEQNTMAQQPDDLLRQQTGILFSCCKMSVGLLDVSVAAKVWVAAEPAKPSNKPQITLWVVAALAQVAAGLYCYFMGLPIAWLLVAGALVIAAIALFQGRRRAKAPSEPRTRVTLRPDEDKLFKTIDAQMQAIDRYVNDFAYLNEQLSGTHAATADGKTVALVSNMLEALYEYEGEARQTAMEAAGKMLEGLGIEAVDYSTADQGLFTTLPSKTETRTMVPAIVSTEDRRLLRRGIAAVLLPAANSTDGHGESAMGHASNASIFTSQNEEGA